MEEASGRATQEGGRRRQMCVRNRQDSKLQYEKIG